MRLLIGVLSGHTLRYCFIRAFKMWGLSSRLALNWKHAAGCAVPQGVPAEQG